MDRNSTIVEQDIFRACTNCAGAVSLGPDGRLACAHQPVIKCRLPIAMAQIKDEEMNGGTSATLPLVTPEWIEKNVKVAAKLDFTAEKEKPGA